MSLRDVATFLWAIFAVYWLIAPRGDKAKVYRQPLGARLVADSALVIGSVLLFGRRIFSGWLSSSPFPRDLATGVAGIAICAAGLILAVWARRILGAYERRSCDQGGTPTGSGRPLSHRAASHLCRHRLDGSRDGARSRPVARLPGHTVLPHRNRSQNPRRGSRLVSTLPSAVPGIREAHRHARPMAALGIMMPGARVAAGSETGKSR
jgi:hypothetical protein